MNKLKEQAGSDSEVYIQNKRTLHNVSAVFGGAGTGKTVAISSIIAEMLAYDDDVEFVYIAPGEAQVEKLKKSVSCTIFILKPNKSLITFILEYFNNIFIIFNLVV